MKKQPSYGECGHCQKKIVDELNAAAGRVWDAFLDYGPVDDGRPEGDEFDAALDNLMSVAIASGAKFSKRRKRKQS